MRDFPHLEDRPVLFPTTPHTPKGGGGVESKAPHFPHRYHTSGVEGVEGRTSAFTALKREIRDLRAQVREQKVALLVKDGEIKGLKGALGAQADGTRGGE
jgi:hypothetical protein